MYVPRLRRINDAIAEMRATDPNTMITRNQILLLIKNGYITPIKFGNAWLINMDELFTLFRGEKNGTENDKGNPKDSIKRRCK